jgi:sugar transferase (PEP-CTERM system associated)
MFRLFKHYVPHAVVLLGLIDFVLLFLAAELGWQLRTSQLAIDSGNFTDRAVPIFSFAILQQVSMISVGVYGTDALLRLRFAIARLAVAISLGIILLSLMFFLIPGSTLWRSILLYAMIFSIVSLVINRILLNGILGMGAFRRRLLVLGAGNRAQRILELGERSDAGFVVVGFIDMGNGEPVIEEALARSAIKNFARYVEKLNVSEVVLALEERRNALPLQDLLRIKTLGVHVNDLSSFFERETGRIDLDSVDPSWLIFSDGFSSGRWLSSIAKRVFDVTASVILLILFGPVVALFALLVKLDSKGPAFFRQERTGLYGQPFYITKLRSMRTDAEGDGKAVWAQANDPRITRIGRFIRKTRIDELPQAWSVLKGEMSFVGPRPERPQFISELQTQIRYYNERHVVKPGITGWAQINYPYGASIDDARQKLEYDLYYAKNYTPFLDILILLQTLRVVLWADGAR